MSQLRHTTHNQAGRADIVVHAGTDKECVVGHSHRSQRGYDISTMDGERIGIFPKMSEGMGAMEAFIKIHRPQTFTE